MNKEQRESKIQDTVRVIEGEDLTPGEEFNIVINKGIEYKVNENYTLYIPALTISQLEILGDLENMLNEDNTILGQLKIMSGMLSKVLKVDEIELKENIDAEDIRVITSLLKYSGLEGKKIFKKNSIQITNL